MRPEQHWYEALEMTAGDLGDRQSFALEIFDVHLRLASELTNRFLIELSLAGDLDFDVIGSVGTGARERLKIDSKHLVATSFRPYCEVKHSTGD